MPRHARIKSQSGIYHVMLRGNNRTTIFHDDEDNERFLEGLWKCLVPEYDDVPFAPEHEDPVAAEVYAYCLMGNHVHLLLKEGSEDVSKMMKRVGIRYASFYKWKYQHSGHVFQDRFRSEPVNDDKYFLAVFRYIVLNPVKAGRAENIGEYAFCSYRVGPEGRFFFPSAVGKQEPSLPDNSLPDKNPASRAGVAPIPVDVTPQQLYDFICSAQPELHPFRERISDIEAEEILREITGLKSSAEFIRLPKAEQYKYIPMLYENNLSIPQITRLTGVAKTNVARCL